MKGGHSSTLGEWRARFGLPPQKQALNTAGRTECPNDQNYAAQQDSYLHQSACRWMTNVASRLPANPPKEVGSGRDERERVWGAHVLQVDHDQYWCMIR